MKNVWSTINRLFSRRTFVGTGYAVQIFPSVKIWGSGPEFPQLRLCLAHMGWPWVQETAMLMIKYPNLYADTAMMYMDSAEQFLIRSLNMIWESTGSITTSRIRLCSDLMLPGFGLYASNAGWTVWKCGRIQGGSFTVKMLWDFLDWRLTDESGTDRKTVCAGREVELIKITEDVKRR